MDYEHKQPAVGEAMQAAMKKRGCDLTLEESREFSVTLLRLYELGALHFYDAEGHEVTLPGEGSENEERGLPFGRPRP